MWHDLIPWLHRYEPYGACRSEETTRYRDGSVKTVPVTFVMHHCERCGDVMTKTLYGTWVLVEGEAPGRVTYEPVH